MNLVMNKKLKLNKLSPYLFLVPAIILYLVSKYYPIFLGVFITFFKFDIMKPPGPFVGFENYITVFSDPDFYLVLRNMLEFLVVIFLLNFWPQIFVAVLVNEVRRNKTFFRAIYFIPAIVPSLAVMVIWKYIWSPDYGLANYLLGAVHLPHNFLWLNDENLVKWCMYFPYLLMAGGMSFVIYLAALQGIPEELYEASFMDGANVFQRIGYVTIPMIKPVIEVMFLLFLVQVANLFNEPLIMTGGGPAGKSETLALFAYKTAMRDSRYSLGLTINTITSVIAFVFAYLQMRFSSKND